MMKYSNLLPLLLICLFGIAIYSNALHSPFQFDDDWSITDNFAIRNISNLKAVWGFWLTCFVTTLTIPIAITLYEIFFLKDGKPLRWRYLAPFLAAVPIVPIVIWLNPIAFIKKVTDSISLPDYICTQLRTRVTPDTPSPS